MNILNPTGSTWKKWDLHVHSPASFGGSDYSQFVTNLSKSEADVIGINDYCTIEGYERIFKSGGVPVKKIFPVIELRMHNVLANRRSNSATNGGVRINFHLIFNNEVLLFEKIKNWVDSLECYNSQGDTVQLGVVLQQDLDKVTVDFRKVVESLEKFDLKKECLIWLPYDEYGGVDEIDHNDNFFKTSLIRKADIMGSSRAKQIDFFKWKDPNCLFLPC